MKKCFVITVFTTMMILGTLASVQADVPTDAVAFNNNYYKVYNISKTWKEAKTYCEALDGHLVTITSVAEQNFISSLSGLKRRTNYWAGGTDEGSEGSWRWITNESWSYTNWASNQPDNYQSGTENPENYLQLCYDWGCKWNDSSDKQDNTASIGFICEWDDVYTGEGQKPNEVPIDDINNIIITIPKEEIPGASYPLLQARAIKVKSKSFTLKWNKLTGATKYLVYGNKCNKNGKKYKFKFITETTKTSYKPKKLKKNTFYKYVVVAVSGNMVTSVSKTIHVGLKTQPNPTKVKVNKKKVSLSLSGVKTFKLKCSIKGTKLKQHRKIAYETDNVYVAKVSRYGKITAVGTGKCNIYAYAQNGVRTKITVTVNK